VKISCKEVVARHRCIDSAWVEMDLVHVDMKFGSMDIHRRQLRSKR
jgi:hypothetical protein